MFIIYPHITNTESRTFERFTSNLVPSYNRINSQDMKMGIYAVKSLNILSMNIPVPSPYEYCPVHKENIRPH